MTSKGHLVRGVGKRGGQRVAWVTGKESCVALEALSIEFHGDTDQSRCIVKNAWFYPGEFVATASFNDRRVVAHGKDPTKVSEEAEKAGWDEAVIVYVPCEDEIMIGGRYLKVKDMTNDCPACKKTKRRRVSQSSKCHS